jgi:hypothetical protein
MTREYIIGEQKGKDSVIDYNEAQAGGIAQDRMRLEFWIAKQLGEDLCATYPNRGWNVDVDIENEVIVVSCPSLSKRMGYRLHIKRDTVKELIPRVRRAAGEILERYGVSRGKIIDPATLETFERDVRDDAISEDARI